MAWSGCNTQGRKGMGEVVTPEGGEWLPKFTSELEDPEVVRVWDYMVEERPQIMGPQLGFRSQVSAQKVKRKIS